MRINIHSQIILFYITLYLLSCGGSNTVLHNSIEPLSTEIVESGLVDYEYEDLANNYNNKYLHLLDIVERMRVYTEEEASRPLSDFEGDTELCINIKKQQRDLRNEYVERLYDNTVDLVTGKKDIDDHLYTLLKYRFDYLMGRDQGIGQLLSPENEIPLVIPPTNKHLFDWLMQSRQFNAYETMKRQQELRIQAVARFEMLNLLIKESFLHCELAELKPITKKLLQASVQLHPILAGTRQDLGHPDEACSCYGLLEPIILASNNKYNVHENFPILLTLKNKIRQSFNKYDNPSQYNMILLQNFIHITKVEEVKGYNVELRRELLGIRKNIDVEVYKAHFIRTPQLVSLKGLGVPKSHNICIEVTDYEISKWPYLLPEPDFLKSSLPNKTALSVSKQLPHNKKHTQKKHKSKIRQQQRKKLSSIVLTEKTEEEAINIIKPILTTENSPRATFQVPITIIEQLITDKQEGLVEVVNPIKKREEKGKEHLTEDEIQQGHLKISKRITVAKHKKFAEQTARPWSFERDWVCPRGLRSFHPQMLSSSYQVHQSCHQDIVDRLFDHQQQCNVSFHNFKTLWKSEGGMILNGSGGSHRELIGPQKEKLFGLFAHNNGQTYGKDGVKYLQTAVLYIGLRPNYSLLQIQTYSPTST